MAFKKLAPKSTAPDSPDLLFRELPRRKFPDVLPHQKEMMQTYVEKFQDKSDVALQLPTGSGKTLVGLLIAEWRRRKYKEKVVYLCPTRQLVHQAVAQAEKKYGLSVVGFTGKKKNYSSSDKAKYQQCDSVAITTYSSLFNTNPYFEDADIIVIDDAHASENYVSETWTLSIKRYEESQQVLYDTLLPIFGRYIDSTSYTRITGQWSNPSDSTFIEKISTLDLVKIHDEVTEIIDTHTKDSVLKYPWSMIRDHLLSCHIYLTCSEIVIRPIVSPTWTLSAFNNAKQRIYMSATLGEGGDLERLMGKTSIERLSIPSGWEMQGVGRRFFMFPGLSLEAEQEIELRRELLKMTDRSLVLVPSKEVENEVAQDIVNQAGLTVFTANDIEESKEEFISSQSSAAIVANRYDGIDFPGEECRLLFIEGMPKGINAQERFFMNRMGAHIIYNERIQTRVLQAIGRCTRSLEDYSAVVITGEELTNYLSKPQKQKYLHKELQAELWFGLEQSKDVKKEDFLENFSLFIKNDTEWEVVNQEIVNYRNTLSQKSFPAIHELSESVKYEVKYQKAMWHKDYSDAVANAESVIGCLCDDELRGYRALWEYLAGSACALAELEGKNAYAIKKQQHFLTAKKAVNSTIPWLVRLSEKPGEDKIEGDIVQSELTSLQLENLENYFDGLGTSHDRSFTKREREILEGLENGAKFEQAHKLLGEHLGFFAGKVESDGSPDPWWQIGDKCLVFEDHVNAKESSSLSASKARQAASHPDWMRCNVDACKKESVEIMSVLVTPVSKAEEGALPTLSKVHLWKADDFKTWAKQAVTIIREIRKDFVEPGDLGWRQEALNTIISHKLNMASIITSLENQIASELLEKS